MYNRSSSSISSGNISIIYIYTLAHFRHSIWINLYVSADGHKGQIHVSRIQWHTNIRERNAVCTRYNDWGMERKSIPKMKKKNEIRK